MFDNIKQLLIRILEYMYCQSKNAGIPLVARDRRKKFCVVPVLQDKMNEM